MKSEHPLQPKPWADLYLRASLLITTWPWVQGTLPSSTSP